MFSIRYYPKTHSNKTHKCQGCGRQHKVATSYWKVLSCDLFNIPVCILGSGLQETCDCTRPLPALNLLAGGTRKKNRWFAPLGYNFGFVLMLAGTLFVNQHLQQLQVERQAIIAELKPDDYLFVDIQALDEDAHPEYRYTVLRVLYQDGDNVLLRVGNVHHNYPASPFHQLKADKAMQRNFFKHETMTVSHTQIKDLYADGTIYDVRRPENLSIAGWIVRRSSAPVVKPPDI